MNEASIPDKTVAFNTETRTGFGGILKKVKACVHSAMSQNNLRTYAKLCHPSVNLGMDKAFNPVSAGLLLQAGAGAVAGAGVRVGKWTSTCQTAITQQHDILAVCFHLVSN